MHFFYRASAVVAAMCFSMTAAVAGDLSAQQSGAVDMPSAMMSTGGFYASLYTGVLTTRDPTATFKLGLVHPNGNINVDTGYRVGGAFGYDFNDNIGTDVEVLYGHSNISSIDVGAPYSSSFATNGQGRLLTIMGNLTLGRHYNRWRPYVGIGGGAAKMTLDADFASGLHDSDWTWGTQAFAGVDYDISKQVSLGGRYRFQYIGATDYKDGNGLPVHLDNFSISSFEVALKWHFGG